MAYTRAKDKIRLSSGRVLTLGEALDEKLLELVASTDPDEYRYVAREKSGDLFWPVGKTLFRSRLGQPLGIR
jgi:hypothetical protein